MHCNVTWIEHNSISNTWVSLPISLVSWRIIRSLPVLMLFAACSALDTYTHYKDSCSTTLVHWRTLNTVDQLCKEAARPRYRCKTMWPFYWNNLWLICVLFLILPMNKSINQSIRQSFNQAIIMLREECTAHLDCDWFLRGTCSKSSETREFTRASYQYCHWEK